MSQELLSEKADISLCYLSSIELEKRNPSVNVICRLCEALEVSPSEVISDEYHIRKIRKSHSLSRIINSLQELSDSQLHEIEIIIKHLHRLNDQK